jgi:hypothetical protein
VDVDIGKGIGPNENDADGLEGEEGILPAFRHPQDRKVEYWESWECEEEEDGGEDLCAAEAKESPHNNPNHVPSCLPFSSKLVFL